MHRRERWYHQRDNNRLVRPFEWGLEYVTDHVNGDDPRKVLSNHTSRVMEASEDFYRLPPITDYTLNGESLTWTSAIRHGVSRKQFSPRSFLSGEDKRRTKITQSGAGVAAVERATRKPCGSLSHLQHAGNVSTAIDASLSSATQTT